MVLKLIAIFFPPKLILLSWSDVFISTSGLGFLDREMSDIYYAPPGKRNAKLQRQLVITS